MKRINILICCIFILLGTTKVQAVGYQELEVCIKFKCSNLLRETSPKSQTGFEGDSNKFNTCQANNSECYLNQFTFESEIQDKQKTQRCYDVCYKKDSYTNDYFKFFLKCSWDCAEKFKPAHIVSICLIFVSVFALAIQGYIAHKNKKDFSQIIQMK